MFIKPGSLKDLRSDEKLRKEIREPQEDIDDKFEDFSPALKQLLKYRHKKPEDFVVGDWCADSNDYKVARSSYCVETG